jgi:hypothetical protein
MHDTSAELMYHIDGEKIGFGEWIFKAQNWGSSNFSRLEKKYI